MSCDKPSCRTLFPRSKMIMSLNWAVLILFWKIIIPQFSSEWSTYFVDHYICLLYLHTLCTLYIHLLYLCTLPHYWLSAISYLLHCCLFERNSSAVSNPEEWPSISTGSWWHGGQENRQLHNSCLVTLRLSERAVCYKRRTSRGNYAAA